MSTREFYNDLLVEGGIRFIGVVFLAVLSAVFVLDLPK